MSLYSEQTMFEVERVFECDEEVGLSKVDKRGLGDLYILGPISLSSVIRFFQQDRKFVKNVPGGQVKTGFEAAENVNLKIEEKIKDLKNKKTTFKLKSYLSKRPFIFNNFFYFFNHLIAHEIFFGSWFNIVRK
jgi:hypothetical protein